MANPDPASSMERQEYASMAEADDSMWWYRALHRNVLDVLRRFVSTRPGAVLDSGCGTGGLLKFITAEEPEFRCQGVELYPPACEVAQSRSGCPVKCGSIDALPYESESFDAVLVTDVLSQKGVNREKAAAEAFRCLRSGGVYIVSEVAFNWLQSYHDRRVGVERRFSRRELEAILESAGFDVIYRSYWNAILFPLVVLRRKVFSSDASKSDVRDYGKPMEWLFGGVMATERAFLRGGWTFPFGVSIMAAGRKPPAGNEWKR